nr:helix-turn-helix domain-containing protein [uncultured Blautia sp.]
MDDQQNTLTYEIIKAAVAGEKWATERVLRHYDDYMTELSTLKERQPDGSVKTYVDEDLKQEIALKLLEEIPEFPMEEAEMIAETETETEK